MSLAHLLRNHTDADFKMLSVFIPLLTAQMHTLKRPFGQLGTNFVCWIEHIRIRASYALPLRIFLIVFQPTSKFFNKVLYEDEFLRWIEAIILFQKFPSLTARPVTTSL